MANQLPAFTTAVVLTTDRKGRMPGHERFIPVPHEHPLAEMLRGQVEEVFFDAENARVLLRYADGRLIRLREAEDSPQDEEPHIGIVVEHLLRIIGMRLPVAFG